MIEALAAASEVAETAETATAAKEVASKGLENNSPFADSARPTDGNMELPKLKDSDGLSKGKLFSDSDRPSDSRGIEQPQLKSVSETTENNTNDSSDNKENSEYQSTYDERIKQTPRKDSDRGEWEDERGESKFVPNDPEIKELLEKYGLDGIEYKDGIPDFSDVSESTVEIDNMTENRAENFKQCDEKCAEQWNKEARDGRTDWTARDVAQWRKENGYSWHERNDMKTCDLIPTRVNDYFGHLGGVSECKKRDASNDGGEFDE